MVLSLGRSSVRQGRPCPDADATAGREHPGYVGSYHVLGHGKCFGATGHCDVPIGPRAPFDVRPAHQLLPHSKVVIVTEPFRRILLAEPTLETVTVTIVPVAAGSMDNALLAFQELRLLSYR